MIKAYTVDFPCRYFAKFFAMNNLNACSLTLKHHVLAIISIRIRLNCILGILNIKKKKFVNDIEDTCTVFLCVSAVFKPITYLINVIITNILFIHVDKS